MFAAMNGKSIDLRKFLLGSADTAVVASVEDAIIEGGITETELEIAEHTLIEEYLEERLLPPEKRLFDRNFLASSARREIFMQTVALRRIAKAAERLEAHDATSVPVPAGILATLAGFFRSRPRLVIASAALLISVVVVGVWMNFRDARPGELVLLEQRYAEINRSDISDLSKIDRNSIVTVFPTRLRSSSKITEIKLPESTDIVFRLSIPPNATPRFRLKIEQANRGIFVLSPLTAHDDELRVIVPRSIFSPGAVRILAEPLNGEPPVIYDFVAV